jgi:hypothetical protein
VWAGLGAEPEAKGVERLGWLQGCWEVAAAGRTVEEQWMTPRGGSMLGMSRTTRAGALVAYESVLVRERGDRLVYVAHPSGQPVAEFLSVTVSDGQVVFENEAHDFPQRIGYRRQGASLHAWVEGAQGGQSRRIEFPYHRVACPGD